MNTEIMPPNIKIMCISNVYTRLMHFQNAGDIEEGHTHLYDHGTLVSSGSVLVEILDPETKEPISQKIIEAPNFIYIEKDKFHRLTALADNTTCACIHALRTNDEELLDPDFFVEQLTVDGEEMLPSTIKEKSGKSMMLLAVPKKKAMEKVPEYVAEGTLQVAYQFPCPVYFIERPDFLKEVSLVSEENLIIQRKDRKLDEMYPVCMSDSYFADPRMAKFAEFVGSTAWNILNEQGYAMTDKAVSFTEMWTQEHHKHSAMDQHVHGYGSQIVGFYFLETPENCSNLVFHDPRSGKVQIDLPEKDINIATPASKMINFTPKPGMMIFANSWLAHSFTRHAADTPIKFVHFNLTVIPAQNINPTPAAEVI